MAGEKEADAGTTVMDPAKAGEQGSSQDGSSLTLPAAQDGGGKSFAELVATAKAAEDAQPKGEPEPEPEPEKGKEGDKGAAEGEAEAVEGEEGTADATDDPLEGEGELDEKGRVIVRPTRFKKLLERSKAYDELTAKLAEMSLEERQDGGNEEVPAAPAPAPEKPQPSKEIQKRITDATEKLKKAKADFDTDAEIAALDELTDAKADLKTMQLKTEVVQDKQVSDWQTALKTAEVQHKEVRDRIFGEDQTRFPDLKNAKSPLFQEVRAVLGGWQATGDPVALAPDAERMAVEIAARRMGLAIPPTPAATTPLPAAKPKPSAPGSVKATARAGNAVIHGGSKGTPPVNVDDQVKQFNALPFAKRLQILRNMK